VCGLSAASSTGHGVGARPGAAFGVSFIAAGQMPFPERLTAGKWRSIADVAQFGGPMRLLRISRTASYSSFSMIHCE
jgi:hypothetical protein